ncbi:hypothetical protein Pfo_010655 [Paulownia fortunei]|nr:hypothetical protein Pfo_010655 [Paulownia fortunei]
MGSKEICSDVVFEIITRTTSLKTLDACKSVCKGWKQLIYDSSFMPTYCQRTKNLSGYFVQDIRHCEYLSMFVSVDQPEEGGSSIGRLPRGMRILASCSQGILCCEGTRDVKYRYYACKPATQQWQPLPNPKLRYITVAVAIMVLRSSPLRYKIVRLSKQGIAEYDCYTYRCEMFDSEVWRWRKTQEVNLPYSELITRTSQSVSAGDSVYWLTNHDNILEFHEANESFHKFRLPEPVHKNTAYNSKQLLEYQGRLGFTCLTEERKMALWLTERDPINQMINWRKKMVVDIESIETHAFPAGFYNSGIVFLKAFFEVIFYKLQDCSLSKVKLDELLDAREVFQFRSDFEPVNLGRIS